MKVALIIIGVCLVIGLIFIVTWIRQFTGKVDPDYLIDYLKHNENTSLTVYRNGETLAAVREDDMFPLASTVKTIVAIEYARQCEEKKIDPSHNVSLGELDQYYIPDTDGGAHISWLDYSKEHGLLLGDSTNLENVVKGMILFSSNANTEYLMELLGIDEINGSLDEMGIEKHEALYLIVGAMLVPTYFKLNHPSYTDDYIESKIKEMSKEDYIQVSQVVSNELKKGEKDTYIENLHTSDSLQRIWSDRLTRSTTSEYATLMEKLNSKTFFKKETQQRLDSVMEGLMENPKNRKWLKHAGQKGGATAFLVTNAAYATDKEGNSTEVAFFTDDLEAAEMEKIFNNLNEFILKVLRDEDLRKKLEKL
ncbi:serine hydrolase [Bacillus sp. BHET2]|uniref:serine hydrolase n=1 Tax=Bacillus sp. BHET2 TaxID=2583818 RepID=UPI00110EA4ED|nr:serine hydrolase [Bacillus sp. BHET2]TMU85177.1 serine hydrolase [Bacillus sp. BHET2]